MSAARSSHNGTRLLLLHGMRHVPPATYTRLVALRAQKSVFFVFPPLFATSPSHLWPSLKRIFIFLIVPFSPSESAPARSGSS